MSLIFQATLAQVWLAARQVNDTVTRAIYIGANVRGPHINVYKQIYKKLYNGGLQDLRGLIQLLHHIVS